MYICQMENKSVIRYVKIYKYKETVSLLQELIKLRFKRNLKYRYLTSILTLTLQTLPLNKMKFFGKPSSSRILFNPLS